MFYTKTHQKIHLMEDTISFIMATVQYYLNRGYTFSFHFHIIFHYHIQQQLYGNS